MKNIISYILVLIYISLYAQAQELQRDEVKAQNLIDYDTVIDTHEVCIDLKNSYNFCYEKSISYPDASSIDDKNISKIVQFYIDEGLKILNEEDINKFVSQNIVKDTNSKWYQHYSWELFAFTPKTITISYNESSFLGGAHGNDTELFLNINRQTGKRIDLKDIIKPHKYKEFVKYVEQFYREKRGLKKDENLQNAGWFKNKFVLAETFAITTEGLYFFYNSYEIQSYSMGQETILIPYDKIKQFLSTKYFDSKSLKEINLLAHTDKVKFEDLISLEVTQIDKNHLKIKALATNVFGFDTKGYFSISFKEITTKTPIKLLHNDFDRFDVYYKGSKIYNQELKKAIKSSYLLVEAYTKKWKEKQSKEMSFIIEIPKGIKNLDILLRSDYDGRTSEGWSIEENLTKDQQGYGCFVYKKSL